MRDLALDLAIQALAALPVVLTPEELAKVRAGALPSEERLVQAAALAEAQARAVEQRLRAAFLAHRALGAKLPACDHCRAWTTTIERVYPSGYAIRPLPENADAKTRAQYEDALGWRVNAHGELMCAQSIAAIWGKGERVGWRKIPVWDPSPLAPQKGTAASSSGE